MSFRELALLADIDHAYIYRLETGAKESPSDEILSKLIRALKAPRREADMLRYLAAHADADSGLVAHVRQDPSVTFDEYASAAGMVYRGYRPPGLCNAHPARAPNPRRRGCRWMNSRR